MCKKPCLRCMKTLSPQAHCTRVRLIGSCKSVTGITRIYGRCAKDYSSGISSIKSDVGTFRARAILYNVSLFALKYGSHQYLLMVRKLTLREQVQYVTQLDVELAKTRIVTHHAPLFVQNHYSKTILTPHPLT